MVTIDVFYDSKEKPNLSSSMKAFATEENALGKIATLSLTRIRESQREVLFINKSFLVTCSRPEQQPTCLSYSVSFRVFPISASNC